MRTAVYGIPRLCHAFHCVSWKTFVYSNTRRKTRTHNIYYVCCPIRWPRIFHWDNETKDEWKIINAFVSVWIINLMKTHHTQTQTHTHACGRSPPRLSLSYEFLVLLYYDFIVSHKRNSIISSVFCVFATATPSNEQLCAVFCVWNEYILPAQLIEREKEQIKRCTYSPQNRFRAVQLISVYFLLLSSIRIDRCVRLCRMCMCFAEG